ncbi:unnamed protein product, partial [Staurois parvus]
MLTPSCSVSLVQLLCRINVPGDVSVSYCTSQPASVSVRLPSTLSQSHNKSLNTAIISLKKKKNNSSIYT